MQLSILICSIAEREAERNDLIKRLLDQCEDSGSVMKGPIEHHYENTAFQFYTGSKVEIITAIDNKQISVGRKRQLLLNVASGEWIVYRDDDDTDFGDYVSLILEAIKQAKEDEADCIGINGIMTTNGSNTQTWCHRLGYSWQDGAAAQRRGFNYLRPIIHFNPVKRELALKAGFKDMKFGEDRDYADRLNTYLAKEVYIEKPLFFYRYSTKVPHKQKYGIL